MKLTVAALKRRESDGDTFMYFSSFGHWIRYYVIDDHQRMSAPGRGE